jgi:hydroxymethylpyrimidine/phosphomethylpyrimidine kinase
MAHPPVVLVVAGWDPSGAAGLAQDLKVLAARGVHACGAPAALTSQGQAGVAQVQGVDPALLRQQLQTLLKEQPVAAVKLGLLYSAAQAEVLAEALALKPGLPLVLDPVLAASSGSALALSDLIPVMKARLFPLCSILTPNLDEAAALTGLPKAQKQSDLPKQAYALLQLGVKAVLLKGGHLDGMMSPDFYLDAQQETWLEAPRIDTKNTRGTGCALASAIAAELAKGKAPLEACRKAKEFLTKALQGSAKDEWGQRSGPIQFG